METKRTRVCWAGCLSATTEMHILKKLDDDSASLQTLNCFAINHYMIFFILKTSPKLTRITLHYARM